MPCGSITHSAAPVKHSALQLLNDNDNDNDTQRSQSNSRQRPGLASVSVGRHDPAKKKSVRTGVACAVGKVCNCTQLNDSVQYIGSRREMRVTHRRSWNELSEFNSKINRILGFRATQRRKPGNLENPRSQKKQLDIRRKYWQVP